MKKINLITFLVLITNVVFSQFKTEKIAICSEIQLVKISEHAYVHISYIHGANNTKFPCNGLMLVDGDKSFFFDTPTNDSTTRILLNYVRDSLKLRIVGFITNDWHLDSMGGLSVINSSGIPSYSNEQTREFAKSKGLPIPVHGFKDSLALKLGNNDIRCYYLGAAHTTDNIVVWIPSEQLLFADCMVKEMGAKDLGFTGDGDLKAYSLTLARVMTKFPTAKIVIPGHGAWGGIELIEHTMKLAQIK